MWIILLYVWGWFICGLVLLLAVLLYPFKDPSLKIKQKGAVDNMGVITLFIVPWFALPALIFYCLQYIGSNLGAHIVGGIKDLKERIHR